MYTVYDTVENPKHLEFSSVAEKQLVEALNDTAIGVVPSSHILENGLDPNSALQKEEPNHGAWQLMQ